MPTEKFYDSEFGQEPLRDLKKRDLLASSDPVHGVPLIYNIFTIAEGLEQAFQRERKANPLLETTPAEVWIVAEIMPLVQEVRANVDIPDRLLSNALQRYLHREAKPNLLPRPDDDEPLVTTIEPYIPGLKKLLVALCDRRKNLREILRLPANAYTVSEASAKRKPTTERQEIFLRGSRDRTPNPRIAKELEDKGVRPDRSQDFRSYPEMLRLKPQNFCSLKSRIVKEYA